MKPDGRRRRSKRFDQHIVGNIRIADRINSTHIYLKPERLQPSLNMLNHQLNETFPLQVLLRRTLANRFELRVLARVHTNASALTRTRSLG